MTPRFKINVVKLPYGPSQFL